MHSAAQHLSAIVAAEKSKTPFYIAGAVLVAWALIVSVGLGLRRPNFPGDGAAQRVVIAISTVLVLGAISAAVISSSAPAKAGTAVGAPAPSSSPPPATGPSVLALSANSASQLAYDTKQLSAKAGTVSLVLRNMSPLEHNVTIAQGSTVLGASATFVGGTRKLTLKLKAGTYTFYCSVPGHRQAGMEGTLSVS